MRPTHSLFVALAGLAAVLCAPAARAADTPVSSNVAPALLALDALEAAAPKDGKDQAAVGASHDRVVALVASNTLQTGEEFLRAVNLLTFGHVDYRIARVRYELLLAATAKDATGAAQSLAGEYDNLMGRIGRPLRFDFNGWSQAHPEYADYDAAPDCVRTVWRDPAAARAAAAAATDNAEVKAIVDADQADRRGNWSDRDEAERNATQARDKARNARMLAIIAAGDLHTADDFARASLVMQHSARFTGFRLAHELAVASLLLGDRRLGRWLVTATYDRMLRSVGHDQRFGTQLGPDGPLRVDETGICDNQRIALGCPALTEARARPAREAQSAKDVAQVTGPNNTLRDAVAGVSAQVPEGWSISGVTTVGTDAKAVPMTNPQHAKTVLVLYYRSQPAVLPPEGAEALLRQHAATKEKERRLRWPEYRNVPASFVFREVNGRPALAWSATYTEGDEACTETLARVFGKNSIALVFLNSPATDSAGLRPAFETVVASLQLP